MSRDKEFSRIGLFGGTFNPIHMGHINSMLSIKKKTGLERIIAIPAHQNPMKSAGEGPSPEQRLEMVKRGLADYNDTILVDEQEMNRGGKSYTIETIDKYSEDYSPEDIHLIVGADEFAIFDQWKSFEDILTKANLIVTSRPGKPLPFSKEELPKGIQNLVAIFDRNYVELTTGRNIQFVRLEDVDISASEIRKRLRTGQKVDRYLPLTVEEFIKKEGLYRPSGGLVDDYEKLTRFCGDVLFKHKGLSVRGFDLRMVEAPCEFSLIVSGTSTRHAQSLAQHIAGAVKEEYGLSPYNSEGQDDGRWILLDYGSLIVHVFYDYVRYEYNLEELWREGSDLRLTDPYEKADEN